MEVFCGSEWVRWCHAATANNWVPLTRKYLHLKGNPPQQDPRGFCNACLFPFRQLSRAKPKKGHIYSEWIFTSQGRVTSPSRISGRTCGNILLIVISTFSRILQSCHVPMIFPFNTTWPISFAVQMWLMISLSLAPSAAPSFAIQPLMFKYSSTRLLNYTKNRYFIASDERCNAFAYNLIRLLSTLRFESNQICMLG